MSESATPQRDPAEGSDPAKPASDTKKASGALPKPKGRPFYRRPGVMAILVLAVIALSIGLILFWRYSRRHETTDDAYVDVVSEQASAQVAGRVIRLAVTDNQTVKAGDLLLELDPSDSEARLEQARAQRAQADAQKRQAEAQHSVYEEQLEQSRAGLETAKANATNAARQWERISRLKGVNPGAVSAEQEDAALAANTSAAAQLNAAAKAIGAAQAQVGYAESLESAAQAAGRSADAGVREAELTLSYAKVFAHIDGQVASRTVTTGNMVAIGTPLMAIVPKEVYITANFKETQLDHMRVGQPVKITLDAYPEQALTGKVDSLQAASGQAFSALPAQNATGNWVKVVQRVPVKIVFDRLPDDPAIRLGPGMSVEVSVQVK